jgi:hypothetical protein
LGPVVNMEGEGRVFLDKLDSEEMVKRDTGELKFALQKLDAFPIPELVRPPVRYTSRNSWLRVRAASVNRT